MQTPLVYPSYGGTQKETHFSADVDHAHEPLDEEEEVDSPDDAARRPHVVLVGRLLPL